MSVSRRIVAALATLAVLVAAPAAAEAKSSSKVASVSNVQVHVDKADKAVKRMKRYARLGNSKAVAKQLKVARTQSAAASRMSRTLASSAVTDTQEVAAAQALTLAGTQYDELVEAVTAIVD
jgi:phosphoribosylanthranilate isomerase